MILAVVRARRWLSRDCEACVCRHKGVTHQYYHSVILIILSTAVGAGNVAGQIWCYMASAGLCNWLSHNKLLPRWLSSSSKLYICTYGTACTSSWCNIHNFFHYASIMLNAYAYLLCSKLGWHNHSKYVSPPPIQTQSCHHCQELALQIFDMSVKKALHISTCTRTHQQICISSSNSDSELSAAITFTISMRKAFLYKSSSYVPTCISKNQNQLSDSDFCSSFRSFTNLVE